MFEKLKEQWGQLGYDVYFAQKANECKDIIRTLIPKRESISLGGSVTLDQLDIVSMFRDEGFNLLDRYAEMSDLDRTECFKKGLTADWLVTSANAITENGEIINVDGNGNRVAPLNYGTQNVLIVIGKNKIVADIPSGLERVRRIAPLNAKRLKRATPCVVDGVCHNCNSPERICNMTSIIHNCYRFPKRIKIILVNEELGY